MKKTKKTVIMFLTVLSFLFMVSLKYYIYTPSKIYNKSLNSVVELKATTGNIESFGTAVFLSEDELITNYHVVSYISNSIYYDHDQIEIRFSDSIEFEKVEIIKFDLNLDLALLKTSKRKGSKLRVNNSKYKVGESVILMGNGNKLGISLTTGVVSMYEVEVSYRDNVNKYIQVDATSSNGVSGGALMDKKGKLIGIITLRLVDDNGIPVFGYVYVIPISIVLNFAY